MERKIKQSGDWEWFTQFVGVRMSCNYYAFHMMSKVLDSSPQVQGIVELGTYTGPMAMYLGMEGVRRDLPVLTIDIIDHLDAGTKKVLDRLGVVRHIGDLFDKELQARMRQTVSAGPVYMVVDGGHKAREFAEYLPMLKPGSVLSVHDWGDEFFPHDCEPFKEKVAPLFEEEWDAHHVALAHFAVR